MLETAKTVNELDKEVEHLDKEVTLLSHDYEFIVDALNQNSEQLQQTNQLLNKFCTKLEKEIVVVDNLERDLRRYQQMLYGILVAVVAFFIQQMILLIH